MKPIFTITIAMLVFSIGSVSFGQANLNTGDNSPIIGNANDTQENHSYNGPKMAGVDCNPNTFFTVDPSGVIVEHTLVGGAITGYTILLTGSGPNLAICDNLNGGAFSPTFYSGDSGPFPSYYDGFTWNTTSSTVISYNPGGNGTNLYYMEILSGETYLHKVNRFDGTNMTEIYNEPTRQIWGDLSVDTYGNVWFVTSQQGMTDIEEILVYSPTGALIASYPLAIDGIHAYGGMILDDILYIGFGSSNSQYPSSLLPINIVAGSAVIGTPIPFGDYLDLASCNHGDPGGFVGIETLALDSKLNVSPNPANDVITINGLDMIDGIKGITITSASGEIVDSPAFNEEEINVSQLSKGMYFINVTSDAGIQKVSFIKN